MYHFHIDWLILCFSVHISLLIILTM